MLSLLPARLQAKIAEADDGCWIWTGGLRGGYGMVRYAGQTIGAHRAVWRELRGPIPEGLVVDHVCRERRCVNPDHLRVVTQRENVHADGSKCIAKRLAERTACERCGGELVPAPRTGKRRCPPCTAKLQQKHQRLAYRRQREAMVLLRSELADLEASVVGQPALAEQVARLKAALRRAGVR